MDESDANHCFDIANDPKFKQLDGTKRLKFARLVETDINRGGEGV